MHRLRPVAALATPEEDEFILECFKSLPPETRGSGEAPWPTTAEEKVLHDEGIRKLILQTEEYFKDLDMSQMTVVGAICPPKDRQDLRSVNFADGEYTFYYHMNLPTSFPRGCYTAYIGPADAGPEQCFDPYSHGMTVEIVGPDGRWGSSLFLFFEGGTRVRIHYKFRGESRVQYFVLPLLPIQFTDTHIPQPPGYLHPSISSLE
ncbi:hypothetical protein ONZ45_g12693 [Pleurotus djamor]|nr:hypothetical protein ONZ45_g12693 [Pleurotus djamor]